MFRLAVELTVVKNTQIMRPRSEGRFGNIPGILDAVNVTNFVAIISWYRHLIDPHARFDQLDDDFSIKMEIIGVAVERQRLKRGDRVNSITGMKLAQARAQHTVLERSEDLVAD